VCPNDGIRAVYRTAEAPTSGELTAEIDPGLEP
jgi:hypothetical protein